MKRFLSRIDDLLEKIVFSDTFKVIALCSLILFALFRCSPSKHVDIRPANGELLVDRVWWDGEPPEGWKDQFGLFIFGDDDNHGVYMSGILAKYSIEALEFEACPANVSITWLADGKVDNTKYAIVHETHGEFDLKLTLDKDPRHGNKPHSYFGKEEQD